MCPGAARIFGTKTRAAALVAGVRLGNASPCGAGQLESDRVILLRGQDDDGRRGGDRGIGRVARGTLEVRDLDRTLDSESLVPAFLAGFDLVLSSGTIVLDNEEHLGDGAVLGFSGSFSEIAHASPEIVEGDATIFARMFRYYPCCPQWVLLWAEIIHPGTSISSSLKRDTGTKIFALFKPFFEKRLPSIAHFCPFVKALFMIHDTDNMTHKIL